MQTPSANPLRLHLVIATHTARHLAPCLASLANQTRPPDTVTVSCDTDDSAILGTIRETWPRVAACLGARAQPVPPLRVVQRPHQGEARPAQVRNNALRVLDAAGELRDRGQALFIDGDMLLSETACARHHALATAGYGLVIGFRANLDEATTAGIKPEAILSPTFRTASLLTPTELESLHARHRKYERQLRLRRLLPGPLCPVKPHKPKLISCHAAVAVAALRRVNAFDEQFTAYGYEDDDLGRRLHALSPPPRVAIAVAEIIAFHLWHPSRAALRPQDNPGHARFTTPRPIRAEVGWSTPAPQPEPCIEVIPG
ncbi:MAG: hypothetical protein AMXMBFR77_10660 [Phycisphaerales bacterium]|nr:galactosyltransferase-related protein [Phycisphaerales bacterium]MDL1905461.1 hypothetical protein [Synechococcales cyanobacterium CNB]GIK18278.1 MAG: hypothetical protein BroJett004_04420 [Planctomycetota bacterium]